MSAIAIAERAKTAITLGESHFREFKSALEGVPGHKSKRPLKDISTNIAETLGRHWKTQPTCAKIGL